MSNNNFLQSLFTLAERMMSHDSRLKLVDRETDACRLEFAGQPVGKDLKAYADEASQKMPSVALTSVLQEVLVPLQRQVSPHAFAEGLNFMAEGNQVALFSTEKNKRAWMILLYASSPKP